MNRPHFDFRALVSSASPDKTISPEPLDATDLNRAEERLGIRLPFVLRAFYEQVGRWACRVGRDFDSLMKPSKLELTKGLLVFYAGPRGDYTWGVSVSRPANPNPAVKRLSKSKRRSETKVFDEGIDLLDFLKMQSMSRLVLGSGPIGISELVTSKDLNSVEEGFRALNDAEMVVDLPPSRLFNAGFTVWRSGSWVAALMKEKPVTLLYVFVTENAAQELFESDPFLVDFW